MKPEITDNRYEQLCSKIQDFELQMHERNRKRIKYGIITLFLLPIVLGLIRWLTDSDKLLFLLIWVLCLFLLACYLIGVEYLDHSVQKKMEEMTDVTDGGEDLDDFLEIDHEEGGGR